MEEFGKYGRSFIKGSLNRLCPFKNKYLKLLRNEFPQIEFIKGTHTVEPELEEMFVADFKQGVCSGATIDGFLNKVMSQMLTE